MRTQKVVKRFGVNLPVFQIQKESTLLIRVKQLFGVIHSDSLKMAQQTVEIQVNQHAPPQKTKHNILYLSHPIPIYESPNRNAASARTKSS